MWWLTFKKNFKKTLSWVESHWRWLVFSIGALAVLILTRKKSAHLIRNAKLALKSGQRERNVMEEFHQKEIKRREYARNKYDKAMKIIEERHRSNLFQLDEKKKKEMQNNLKKVKDNPDEIDRVLMEQFGIQEVK